MTTTKEKFTDYTQRVGNYGHIPRNDVEIIVDAPKIDRQTGETLTVVRNSVFDVDYFRADGSRSYSPNPTCNYCGASDVETVVYRQHAYYDAVECSRCEGVSGWSIGD